MALGARLDGVRRFLSDVASRTLAGLTTAAVLALLGVLWASSTRPRWATPLQTPIPVYWLIVATLAVSALVSVAWMIGLRRRQNTLRTRQTDVEALSQANSELRVLVARLEERLRAFEALEFHHDAYWLRLPDNSLDGPFLASTWDRERKQARMLRRQRGSYGQPDDYFVFLDQGTKETARVPVSFLKEHRVSAYLQDPEWQKPKPQTRRVARSGHLGNW